jgi:hypothetical protein
MPRTISSSGMLACGRAVASNACGTCMKMHQRIKHLVADVGAGAIRNCGRQSRLPPCVGDRIHRQGGEVGGRPRAVHLRFRRSGAVVIGNPCMTEVDGDALDAQHRARARFADAQNDIGLAARDRRRQCGRRARERCRQFYRRDVDVIKARRQPSYRGAGSIDGVAAECFETADECAHRCAGAGGERVSRAPINRRAGRRS